MMESIVINGILDSLPDVFNEYKTCMLIIAPYQGGKKLHL